MGRKAGLLGESGKFCRPASHLPEEKGSLPAIRLYKGRSGWGALCGRSERLGNARPPDNACLSGGRAAGGSRGRSASPAGSGEDPPPRTLSAGPGAGGGALSGWVHGRPHAGRRARALAQRLLWPARGSWRPPRRREPLLARRSEDLFTILLGRTAF